MSASREKIAALIKELQKEETTRQNVRSADSTIDKRDSRSSKDDQRKDPADKTAENKERTADTAAASNEGIAITSKSGKFRFSRQRGHFVYKYHIDKEYLTDFFTEINRGQKLKLLIVAHETSDKSHPYEHTHVLVDFGRIIDFRSPAFADIKLETESTAEPAGLAETSIETIEVHPWIGGAKDDNHWKALIRYMAKQDPENAKWKNYAIAESTPGSFADQIWSQASLQDALSKYGDDNSAIEIIAIWNAKPAPAIAERKWYPIDWQKDCLERISRPGNSRYVNWYVDQAGAGGKTQLVREIIRRHPKDAIFIKGNGLTSKDMARMLKNEHNRGNKLRIVVFDLPRTMIDSTTSLYTMLEACADGMVSSGKYDSDNLIFDPEHVVVFANFWPEKALLSKDRWKIHKLSWEDENDPPTAWASYAKAVLDLPTDLTVQQRDETLAKHAPNITSVLVGLTASADARAKSPSEEHPASQESEPVAIDTPAPNIASNDGENERPDNVGQNDISDEDMLAILSDCY